MKKIFAALAFLAFAFPAVAADQLPLALQQCSDIFAALTALSVGQYQAVDKDGKPITDKEGKAITLPYRLGAQRMTISLDMAALKTILDAGEVSRVGIVKETLPDGVPPQGAAGSAERATYERFTQGAAYKAFFAKYQELLDAKQNVTLGRLKFGDQKGDIKIGDPPDADPIPPTILQSLLPIIDR